MIFKLLKIVFLVTAFSQTAIAASSSGGSSRKLLLVEVNGLLGYGSSKASTDTSTPTITSVNVGLGLGVNIKSFSLGLSYDYRSLVQLSDVDPNVGNRRGTFISPISIFVKLNFEAVKFGVMIINSGKYELSNTTLTGQTLSYTKPSGFRFSVNLKKMNKVEPTFFYESVSFSERELNGVASSLSSNLNYSNYGVGARYEF